MGAPLNPVVFFSLVAIALFCIALHSLILSRHLLRKLLALNIMGSAIFLLFTAMARRTPGAHPDPVPHAMVLTGIVVTMAATGLAVVLVRKLYATEHRACLPEDAPETRPNQ
jgi:multicomponent Na+:H+ antiporter subunit C